MTSKPTFKALMINSPQKAKDEAYKDKLGELNYALKNLAKKIEVKVYEYEFLLE